ncbi:division/cell wall cluster transcriptional repressor MraZ [Saccharicrinis sp. FJH62]|uniref:division/cell wall cluster transcriptional repressor MraZ n=1 Tax=Saccharicrinis sp. FJH62 TaxID=3344657 RepID=UPI0035D4D534
MSFVGDYTVKADSKGRIAVPSAFRKLLERDEGERFVFRKDVFQNCLVLIPIKEWEVQVAVLRKKLNDYNRNHKKFKAQFFRDTAEVEMDKTGRVLIPKKLYDMLALDKEIVLAGMDKVIEVWDKATYDGNQMDDGEFAALAEEILGNENLENVDQ